MMKEGTRKLAVFIDYDNIGIKKENLGKLMGYIRQRGRVIVKMAYADWSKFRSHKKLLIENSIDLIEMPSNARGKNAADIKLAVDAVEVAKEKKYIDTIVVVSGDSDYTPLISKLREYDKYVIVIANERDINKRLTGYSDEVIRAQDLFEDAKAKAKAIPKENLEERLQLLEAAVTYLIDNGKLTTATNVKQQMLLSDPSFNEKAFGFDRFSQFLKEAEKKKVVVLEKREHDFHVYNYDEDVILFREVQNAMRELNKNEGVITNVGGRGFGFLEDKKTGETLYFTRNDVMAPKFKDLNVGDVVLFSLEKTDKNYNRARMLRRLGEKEVSELEESR